MKKIRVFEAFAGYGSQSIALELLHQNYPDFDFEVVGFSEIDQHAIKAYQTIHGEDIPNLGDITQIDWEGYNKDFDLFTYSFPCQDISMAGKQRGFSQGSGSRSSLLWECERAIISKRPQYLLMENVKALTQQKFRKEFYKWQLVLQNLGYSNYTQVLDASQYGVPQHRERVFMVSILNNTKPFYFPTPFPLEKRLKDVLEDEVDEKYYLSDKAINGILFRTTGNDNSFKPCKPTNPNTDDVVKTLTSAGLSKWNKGGVFISQVIQVGNIYPKTGNPQAGRIYSDKGVSPTLDTMEGGNRQPKVVTCAIGVIEPKIMKVGNYSPSGHNASAILDPNGISPTVMENHGTVNAVIEPRIDIKGNIYGGTGQRGRVYGTDGLSPCLMSHESGGGVEPKIMLENEDGANVSQEKRIYSIDGISCTIDTFCPSRPKIGEHGEIYRIRRITPREAFRLMDVPEHYIDRMLSVGISNSQLYKLAGNSIVVSCLYHIFRKMFVDTEPDAPKNKQSIQLSLF